MIVAHAGHRVDTAEQDRPLFPVSCDGRVYRRLYLLMLEMRPRLVVSAASGGADLLMLRTAEDLFVPTVIALPLPVDEFRRRSVANQGDRWVEAYDRALDHADDVIVADYSGYDDWSRRGNDLILDSAAGADGSGEPIAAVVVKSGRCSGSSGTADFATKAEARGWPIHVIDPEGC